MEAKLVEVTTFSNMTSEEGESKQVNWLDRMMDLHDQIVARVWDKYQHPLTEIDEWDSELDKIDAFHLLGGKDPVVVMPSTAQDALGIDQDQQKHIGMENHSFFVIAIDPQLARKDIWKEIQNTLSAHLGIKETPRNARKQAIPKYKALQLAKEGLTFAKIGLKFGVDKTTAHKAVLRDYMEIHGTAKAPNKKGRKSTAIYQLSKTCATCVDAHSCKELRTYNRKAGLGMKIPPAMDLLS